MRGFQTGPLDGGSDKMIRTLLVANRGEIAVRVIRACRELGIVPVTVYSEADRDALHVQLADRAVCIGPAAPLESYLNIDAVIAAALETGAEAIHPGYGFLSESAEFAACCRSAGLIFVGPPVEAIRLMGDKSAAKRLARSAGVPVVPGYDGGDQSDGRLSAEAERIGYPVLVKAVAGGGGKGMHAVELPAELPARLAQARREARLAFGDDRLLLERLLQRPRHIEVQVLGDEHGALVALGERECSIQRRHQKVIEEAPSPAVGPELRQRLCGLAVALARAAGYTNAGTLEFLLDRDGSVYFLEMNTRLQVEHAVTEAVYGVDLVRLQIELAAGEPMRLTPKDLTPRGHAIECRLYAEDPAAGYLPRSGQVLAFRVPEGPGLRNDAGTFAGDTISPYYDPLLAKLTAFASDRPAAVARMRAALEDCTVLGLPTNLELLDAVLCDPEFARGEIDIEFLDRKPELARRAPLPAAALFAATAADLLGAGLARAEFNADSYNNRDRSETNPNPWARVGPWRQGGQGLGFRWQVGDRECNVQAFRVAETGQWRLTSGDASFSGAIEAPIAGTLLLREAARIRRFAVAAQGRVVWVGQGGRAWKLARPAPPPLERRGGHVGAGSQLVAAPMPGRVARVNVREGEVVGAHQVLIVMEAMKMEHVLESPAAGVVLRLHCAPGDLVQAGALLVELGDAP